MHLLDELDDEPTDYDGNDDAAALLSPGAMPLLKGSAKSGTDTGPAVAAAAAARAPLRMTVTRQLYETLSERYVGT